MFMFDRCHRSSAAVALVKYKCDSNNLRGTFTRSKILLTEKLTSGALVTPTPGHPDSKIHGANVGATWDRQDPGGPYVGHMNLAILADTMVSDVLLTQGARFTNISFPTSSTKYPNIGETNGCLDTTYMEIFGIDLIQCS